MRYLIIPDVHDKVDRVNRLLDREKFDQAIFQSDFFDDWETGPIEARRTAEHVSRWLDSHICCLGNHDLSYGWGYRENCRQHICSGWTAAKAMAINDVLAPGNQWMKFRTHFWIDEGEHPWLISHAGVHPAFVQESGYPTVADRRAKIDKLCDAAWWSLNSSAGGHGHKILGVGVERGGMQSIGGILWCDFGRMKVVRGINQLVGHTFDKRVRTIWSRDCQTTCIDTAFRHYAVIEDGELTILDCV